MIPPPCWAAVLDFNIRAYAKETGLGNPIGGSFMLVAPELCT